MDTLILQKKYKVIVPEYKRCWIYLVGCGGTGSFVAQNLARLDYFLQRSGRSIDICFIDPDQVREENVGRQNFCPQDVGKPKSQVLSERYNFAYGSKSSYSTLSFKDLQLERSYPYDTNLRIIIGAVDTTLSRLSIDTFVRNQGISYWWLDCGNSYSSGQVLLGNSWRREDKSEMINPLGICKYLPLPSIQHPELIDPNFDSSVPRRSCAQLIDRGEQNLFVNQLVASFVSSFLYRLLVLRELDHYAAYFDFSTCSSKVYPITLENLSKYMTKKLVRAIASN